MLSLTIPEPLYTPPKGCPPESNCGPSNSHTYPCDPSVTVGKLFTVKVNESATEGLATQSSELNISTLSTSLFTKVPLYVNVLLDTTVPLSIQLMVGFKPPFVGVAVNVALSPLHKVVEPEVVKIMSATGALTIVTWL